MSREGTIDSNRSENNEENKENIKNIESPSLEVGI